MSRARRSTFQREPELFMLTPGLRVFAIVCSLVLFLAGGAAGLVVGLNW